jgi:hypothetical protein
MIPDLQTLGLGKKTKKKLVAMIERFNEAIEELIVSSALQATRILVDPRESGIFSLASMSHVASEATVRQSPDLQEPDQLIKALSTPVADETSFSTLANNHADYLQFKNATQVQGVMLKPASLEADLEHELQIASFTTRPPILVLRQGVSCTFIFNKAGETVRFHTSKIHVELSFEQAHGLAGINSLPSTMDMSQAITVEVTWLDDKPTGHSAYTEDNLVDLNADWIELETAEGILFTKMGLLMRKGNNVVDLRAFCA